MAVERGELKGAMNALWNHMTWDDTDTGRDRIYPIAGHEDQLMQGIKRVNELKEKLGSNDRVMVIYGQVKIVPKDFKL